MSGEDVVAKIDFSRLEVRRGRVEVHPTDDLSVDNDARSRPRVVVTRSEPSAPLFVTPRNELRGVARFRWPDRDHPVVHGSQWHDRRVGAVVRLHTCDRLADPDDAARPRECADGWSA
jgi:hypothetical protein